MASRRSFMRLTPRAIAPIAPRVAPRFSSLSDIRQRRLLPSTEAIASSSKFQQVRWHSSVESNSKIYDFDKVKSLVESPDDEIVLIDVREPSEYGDGFIPTAINIPIKSQPDALFLPPDEFEDRFGFMKPPPDKEVVFYCRSGVRSSAAAQLALQHGYSNVSEYRGSWLDWEKNSGPASKHPGNSGSESPV